jgi:hypothetical protein
MRRARLRSFPKQPLVLKDDIVQRQIRDRFAQPAILKLKLLQPLCLFDLQPAKFLAPANGMDGSPSHPHAESLQQEGELQ